MNRDDVAALHEQLEQATTRAEAAEAELAESRRQVTQLLAAADEASVRAIRLQQRAERFEAALQELRRYYDRFGIRASEVVPLLRRLGLWLRPQPAREAQTL